jgi:hypothetical protein
MKAHVNNTAYIAPPYFWGIAAITVFYLVVVGYFMNYLKRTHPVKWEELGRPSIMLNNSIRNGLATLGFIFGAKHRELHDPRVSLLVWAIRALLALILALYAIGLMFNLIVPR